MAAAGDDHKASVTPEELLAQERLTRETEKSSFALVCVILISQWFLCGTD